MGRTENVVGWGIAGATVRIMQQYIKRQHPFSSIPALVGFTAVGSAIGYKVFDFTVWTTDEVKRQRQEVLARRATLAAGSL